MKLRMMVAGGVAVALVMTACSDDKVRHVSVAGEASVVVVALDNAFQLSGSIAAGTEIVFANAGRNDHNVVPSDGDTSWGVAQADFRPGDEYRHTFTEPGTYEFFCSIHGTAEVGMTGSLTVVGPDGTTGSTPAAAAPPTTAPPAEPATVPPADDPRADGVLEVPGEVATIQGAVDAAHDGDLVLVAPGTYREAVNVSTDNLTIRGLDRNTVILDGGFELDNGVRVLGAKGVAVENMTAMNYTANGFFFTKATGYRGSYLTSYRTGDYGIYAFDSTKGQIEHAYAAGSPDAGVYIGGCFPCDAVITDVVSEYNGFGYSGTNAGGNLLIVNSVFRYNRVGLLPNSGSYEPCYPERETTIVGNIVHSNNQTDTPVLPQWLIAMGNGILSAGGVRNTIERNLVYDHNRTGIGLAPAPEDDPNDVIPAADTWDTPCAVARTRPTVKPDGSLLWDSQQNTVRGNVLFDNREADLMVGSVGTDPATFGHCFADNTFATSAPNDIEAVAPCDGTGTGNWGDGAYDIAAWLTQEYPPSVDYTVAVLPPLDALATMPDAASAPAHPATDVPFAVDLAAIEVPAKPAA